MNRDLTQIMKIGLLLILCIMFGRVSTFGHGDVDHNKKKKENTTAKEIPVQNKMKKNEDATHKHTEDGGNGHDNISQDKPIKAEFSDFPTLHPLVVHFPIVLLLLAAISQLAGLFIFKKELSWVTLFLITGGFIGAFTAGNFVHPHTQGLDEFKELVMQKHEHFADFTIWLSGFATVVKIFGHFFLKRKLWIELTTMVIILASAYCVSIAGHYGAQLIHIEGVGAQGKFIEINSNQTSH